jgi:hypothetical protein
MLEPFQIFLIILPFVLLFGVIGIFYQCKLYKKMQTAIMNNPNGAVIISTPMGMSPGYANSDMSPAFNTIMVQPARVNSGVF